MIRVLGNLLVLSISLAFSLLAAEFPARILLDPVDFLNPTLVADELLNHRIDRHTGGHDAWGFRNLELPDRVDIACIGDSMTYGVSARARDSWPAVLGSIRGEKVYNMGLGGYGPIQYLHLMRVRAVELHPKMVIVGLYFGNDFLDAYNVVRFNENWSEYGTFGGSQVQGPAVVLPRQSGKFLGGLRDWLSRNSVLYGLVTQLPLFDFVRAQESAARMTDDADNLIAYRDAKHNVLFDVSPGSRFLDMNDPRIKAAMEITKRAMIDIQSEGERVGIRLVVVLIPTKERVYATLLKQAGHVEKNLRLADALQQEDAAREVIVGFLRERRIDVVDLLPALEAEVVRRDLYPLADGHPNHAGYRVIAETINR